MADEQQQQQQEQQQQQQQQQQRQQQLLQELSESLECQICLKTTDDPHLCPKCSKFFCFGCIREWIQKSGKDACPNCMGTVCLTEFVKFRWDSGIETIRNLVVKPDTQHKHTTAENLDAALRKAQQTFSIVSERIDNALAGRKESLKKARDGLIKSINILVQQEFREINQQYKDKLAEVDAWSTILSKELDKVDVSLYALQDSIGKECSPETEHQLELQCQVLTKKLELLGPAIPEHKFYCKLMPAPTSWRFTVRNFGQARTANKIQYSDLVRDDLGNTWRLEIHPNGFDDARNVSLSVFLQLYEGVEGRYRYTIELPHRTHPHTYEDEDQFQLRKGWGQNHFVDLKLLFDEFLENDCFELRFSVRSPDLIERFACLRKYTEKLERDNSTLREECSVDCVNEVCCIRNVAEVCNAAGCLYSDTFRDDLGGSWRVQVYPGGNGDTKGLFAGIFLELLEGIPNVYEFSVDLLNESSKKSVKKSLEHNFQPWMPFGWKNFISREDLLAGGFVKKDAIMLRLAVRPPTVGQKFNYLRQYHDKALRDLAQVHSQPKASSSLLNSKPFEAPISFLRKMLPRTPSQEQASSSQANLPK